MNRKDHTGEMTMDRKPKTGRLTAPSLALAVSTAIAGLTLAPATTSAAPRADVSFENAQAALAKGKIAKAIQHAEAAVLANPREPSYRALLGAAYLEDGRFAAASTSFADAMELGDNAPRTVLSFALARIALGDSRGALGVLDQHAGSIDPADLGLALALAGQPERGVHVLINAVRSAEQSTPKLRQNLAYSYALAGNWRAAQVMAAEDVSADQLQARLAQWAEHAAPEMYQHRIASLLDVTPRADAGQPRALALANFPDPAMLAAATAQTSASDSEMAFADPVGVASPAPSPGFSAAFAANAPAPATVSAPASRGDAGAPRFVSKPVVQQLAAAPAAAPRAAAPRAAAPRLPAPRMAAAVSQRRMAAPAVAAPADKGPATHLVQLGAYNSRAEALQGWTMLQGKFPQLKGRKPTITQALVNGRTFWRVAAEGFTATGAKSMCGTVKSAGRGCFAYAATTPPAGAVKRDVQVASRSR